VYDKIEGSLESDGNGRARCVNFASGKNLIAPNAVGIQSLRITRAPEGRITSYWKAIVTSSEQINYKVTVGITSTESDRSTSTAYTKLTNALKTGISLQAGVKAKAGPADVGVSGGYSRVHTVTDETVDTLARELASVSVDSNT